VLTVEDWAEVRRLARAEKMPIKAIARTLGISRNTVRAALAAGGPPKYQRSPAGSAVDAFEPRIRELLQAYPTMPATVIAERVGWERGLTVLKDRVRELRPAYLPADPASRTAYDPGELAQCDFWFPAVRIPAGFGQERGATRLPVLTMVSGYSRWLSAVLVPSRHAADLFAGWWQLIAALGGVPRALVWDGEGAIGRWRAGKPELTAECQAFRGTLGAKVVVCKPADPESKGLVERANGYLETSFLPGRRFTSPGDFNTQLAEWTALVNTRVRRALGCAPADRIAADRHAMLTLPPAAPETGWRLAVRLPRDHYVRLDSNDYSVHPAAIGRRVEVVASLDRVQAWCGGQLAADHERSWAWHQVITDPEHKAAAVVLRRQRVSVLRPAGPEPEVEQRSLAVYDALTAGDGEGAA
jgi:transposase